MSNWELYVTRLAAKTGLPAAEVDRAEAQRILREAADRRAGR